jgi:hypothetical protein
VSSTANSQGLVLRPNLVTAADDLSGSGGW